MSARFDFNDDRFAVLEPCQMVTNHLSEGNPIRCDSIRLIGSNPTDIDESIDGMNPDKL